MAAQRIGIAVVEHQGAYLVGVRGPDQPLAGCAEFPGGKCEPDESPRDCAVRECREETGLAVIPQRLIEEVRFSYPHGDVELHFWLCQPAERASISTDHRGYRWVPTAELGTLNFPEANRPVIEWLRSPKFGIDTQPET